MCFDQDPPYGVFLLNAGMEGAQKCKAKVYFGEGQVLAGRAQPKEQTEGAEGTTNRFAMAAQPQGGLCHARHCSSMGAGENFGLHPRAPTLQGGAQQQTPHKRVPNTAYMVPWSGLALAQCWPCCKELTRRLELPSFSVFLFVWYIPAVSPPELRSW